MQVGPRLGTIEVWPHESSHEWIHPLSEFVLSQGLAVILPMRGGVGTGGENPPVTRLCVYLLAF